MYLLAAPSPPSFFHQKPHHRSHHRQAVSEAYRMDALTEHIEGGKGRGGG